MGDEPWILLRFPVLPKRELYNFYSSRFPTGRVSNQMSILGPHQVIYTVGDRPPQTSQRRAEAVAWTLFLNPLMFLLELDCFPSVMQPDGVNGLKHFVAPQVSAEHSVIYPTWCKRDRSKIACI